MNWKPEGKKKTKMVKILHVVEKKQQVSLKVNKTHRTRLPTKQSSQRTVLTQWFGGKEVLKRTVKQHQETNGNLSEKKTEIVRILLGLQKSTSFANSERNSPNKASSKAKF